MRRSAKIFKHFIVWHFMLLTLMGSLSGPLLALPEESLSTTHKSLLQDFMTKGQRGYFSGVDGAKIAHFSRLGSNPRPAVAILPGYSEAWVKYDEVMSDFFNRGFDVFAMDHRGMGLSTHLAPNPLIAHVERFSDYVDDTETWLRSIVLPNARGPVFILAHSTGALIATYVAPRLEGKLAAFGLNAPLYGLNTGHIPRFIAEALLAWQSWRGRNAEIAFGRSLYDPKLQDPSQCRTTHSRERCGRSLQQLIDNPEIQIGAPSNGWVREILRATSQLPALAKMLGQSPVLIQQSAEDDYVDNPAEAEVCRLAQNCAIKSVSPGRHELLQETDAIRQKVLDDYVEFFKKMTSVGHK